MVSNGFEVMQDFVRPQHGEHEPEAGGPFFSRVPLLAPVFIPRIGMVIQINPSFLRSALGMAFTRGVET